MSSGKVHARHSIILVFPTVLVVSQTLGWVSAGGAAIGCGMLGQVLSPDLDQQDLTRSDWIVLRRLGPLGGLWIAAWFPYAFLVPHRHWASHAPVIGTVIRLLYLLILPALCVWWKQWTLSFSPIFGQLLIGLFIGLCISDTAHWITDGCPT
ncbi:MAG: DUF2227 family putative metal-binding protein [Chloroflexota bacterium]